ncbi:hypothetical protein OC709_00710 ['Planchonia careya' phytoplasma]|nr:hypothetical protein ['Planchonia careya' phytoplasma]MDO8030041.1 hypothetical protein ['Planchonia careya' phytoplasma]
MHTTINNIKKFFNIKNLLNIFIILILFTFNYITLNSKFLLKANTTEETSIADNILQFLKEIKSKPEIEKNSSLLSQCNDLINEYDQIKKDVYTFFYDNQKIKKLKLTLFNDQKDDKISAVKNKINIIDNMAKNLPEEDKNSLKTTLEELDGSITEYLSIIKDIDEIISYLQNTTSEEITIDSLTDRLTKFQEICNNLQDKTEKLIQLVNDILALAIDKHLNNITEEINQLKTTIEAISLPVNEQLIKDENIINQPTTYKGLSLDLIIKETFEKELTKLKNLKDEINQVINTDNSNNDNFKLSSDNNSSLATKLFYLLCVIITITFLLIIYQFNKKPQHKNHL